MLIFISRDKHQIQHLFNVSLKKNWFILAQSLISFESVPFSIPKNWDVVFFPSSRSAEFFLSACTPSDLLGKKIACAGNETAKSISKYSELIDFIPSKAGNTELVQKEFQQWLGDRKVIYAGSNIAKKSILENLPENQLEFIHVYNTFFSPIKIRKCDVYVFSSPSNVRSFLTMNTLNNDAIVIAWGSTTADELVKNNISIYQTLDKISNGELIEVLSSIR